jgi:RNA polymerase sigma-70 factor, ECF subfamily
VGRVSELTATLVEHSAVARDRLARASEAERDDLEARLRRHYDAGRSVWPDVDLSEADFARALAAHVTPDGPLVPEDLHASDFFLAAACAAGVRGAIALLARDFLSRVPGYIARVSRPSDRDTPDDVAQAIAERVVVSDGARPGRISEYSGRGPLGGWLRVLSVRMALNAKRGGRPAASFDDAATAHAGFDPELDHFRWRYRETFKSAFEAAFAELDEEQRLLLRLHASGRHRGEDVAKILGVERSTVMRRLARAREVLFDATKRRMTSLLGVSPTEFDSIARAVHSQIELTLSRVLAPRPPDERAAHDVP